MASDTTLWNKIMFGRSRIPLNDMGPPPEYTDEKQTVKPTRKWRSIENIICLFVILLLFNMKASPESYFPVDNHGVVTRHGLFSGLVQSGVTSRILSGANETEVFEVTLPFYPDKFYGKPVHSEVLLDHVFDSWGHPALVKFSPPSKKFNKVVLTLNTTVHGVQYDRLAHLYVGDAEVWRTSTAEPGGKHVHSSFKKEISAYANLFSEEQDILFQLDNVVTDELTGKFHVQLYVDFYESDFHPKNEESSASDVVTSDYKIFDIRKPASKVHPLVTPKGDANPPIKYLPSDEFKVILPSVPKNTTRLRLDVFASANADEEFWYSNVLDRFVNKYEKDRITLLGHGPARFINIYVDGQKVASQTPQPFIFTGGLSPSLWSPVVGINAFDLPSINIDVSGLLPLLWGPEEHELAISVSNGLDEVYGDTSGIGNDWIISANLLSYESADVKKSSGEVVHIGDRTRGSSIGVSPPFTSTIQQVISGILQGELTSALTFELADGKVLNTTVSTHTKGEISNVQSYKSAFQQQIVHVGHSSKSFLITDNSNDNSVIHQTNVSLSYPLVIKSKLKVVPKGLDLQVEVVNVKETTLKINEKRVMKELASQNGTSLFHIRMRGGNHGTGALTTKFKALVSGSKHEFKYKRRVEDSNGEVTLDKLKFEAIDDEDWEDFGWNPLAELAEFPHGCMHAEKAEHHGVYKHHGKHQGKHDKHDKHGMHDKHDKHGKHRESTKGQN